MVMLPYMPLVCLVALIGAVLQVQGRFASTAAAPILLNIVVVTTAILATRNTDDAALVHSIYWVSASVIAAGLLQVGWQLVALLKLEKPTFSFAGTKPAMASLKAIFLPMVVGLAAFQLNTFMDSLMAMALSVREGASTFTFGARIYSYPLEEASVAALNWSQRLYEFPLGIFGIAIATAIFPALSHAAANRASQGLTHFATIYRQGLRLSVFIGLPASVGLMVVALPLSRLAYERGQFTLEDSQRVAWILLGYAPAIWAYSMNHVLTRAFYALGDSRTPVKVSLAMVGMNLLLNLILVWPLGAQGFAIATAVGAILQSVILILAIEQYLREPLGREVWMSWGKSLLASAVMGLTLLSVYYWIDPASLRPYDNFILLMAMVAAGGLIYAAAAWLAGCPEIRWILRRRAGA
jgi:putative peptidoglycan lipid II flippase